MQNDRFVLGFYSKYLEKDTFLCIPHKESIITEVDDYLFSYSERLIDTPYLMLFSESQVKRIISSFGENTRKRSSFFRYEDGNLTEKYIFDEKDLDFKRVY